VRHFNMGAMEETRSLNIFQLQAGFFATMRSPQADGDSGAIESVIAHEYFP